MSKINISKCFTDDIVKMLKDNSEKVYQEINKLSQKPISDYPTTIECLTEKEIEYYRREYGAGHGLYVAPNLVKINPNMSKEGILLNFIHENIHHALPNASEKLVDIATYRVGCQLNINKGAICDALDKME